MAQTVKYARSADGTSIAWSEAGEGPTLIYAALWLSPVGTEQNSPAWSHWARFLNNHFRHVRYNERGTGLSDAAGDDLGFDRWLEDLEAVADACAPQDAFILLGIDQATPVAAAYAAKHPDRVSRLILYGAHARGWRKRDDPDEARFYQAVIEAITLGWSRHNSVFKELLTSRYMPDASQRQIGWFNNLLESTKTAEGMARIMTARGDIDVTAALPRISAPTLVIHATGDQITPASEGRAIVKSIPNAEFLALESQNHILLQHEPAWARFKSAILDFVKQDARTGAKLRPELEALSTREREIFDLICEAKTYPDIAAALSISEKTVRNHASNIFKTLGVKSRSEAMLYKFQKS